MIDIQARVAFEAAITRDKAQTPEAVSVLVLTSDEATAMQVGPLLAQRLYPHRPFGAAISATWVNTGEHIGFEVAVLVQQPNAIIISRQQNNR